MTSSLSFALDSEKVAKVENTYILYKNIFHITYCFSNVDDKPDLLLFTVYFST